MSKNLHYKDLIIGLFTSSGFSNYKSNDKRLLLLVGAFLLLINTGLLAQTPNFFKGGGTGTNSFPFNTASVKRSQHIYAPGDLPGATSGIISRIYFRAATTIGPGTYSDFKVSLKQTPATVFPGTGSTEFFTALTPVIVAPTYTIPATTTGAWIPLDLQTPFLFDASQTLVIEVEMSTKTSTSGITVYTTTGPAAPNHKRLTATTLTATTGNSSTIWSDFGIDVGPSSPCIAPPTAGQAVSSGATACPGSNFTLSVTGHTTGTGQTYQWQSSANGTTGWMDIPGGTATTFITNQTTTSFYRLAVTCSGQTAYSGTVQVTTNTSSVNGVFTINKNAGASATNFTSFAAAVTSIECGGVNGPVVFNVDSASGPYAEHVIIPAIPGASVTNSITFNGNGAVLIGTGGTPVLKLEGADYIRVNDLALNVAAATTAGQVVHLTNGADNNIFTGNTIAHSTSTTTTSHGVYIYGGSNNNNTFQNNSIIGGYYGIYNYGTSAATMDNNKFINNTIRDQYIYPVYNYYATNTLIDGNDISRATRTAVSSFYGITLSTGTTGTTVTRNRIHNTHDAATSLTGLVYALYVTGADAPLTAPNVFTNNLIYNINNTGTLYGIYTTSSDGSHFYHTTIDLTNTNNTGTVRGFYQLTSATDVRFINNIVTINAGTTGAKHALYFGTAASAITSNNNVLRVTGGSASSGIGYSGTNYITLADWQAATSQDANSVSADPVYASPATGNFTPTNPAVNNIGQGVGVTTDIIGTARNPNMPDAGAYEFMNLANDIGISAILSPNSVCGLTNSETITAVLTNFGTNQQTNIPVSYTINGVTGGSQIIPGPLNPGASITFTFNVPVNLSTAGGYTFVATANMTGDVDASNNSITKVVTNALFPSLPIMLDFETPATGLAAMKTVTNSKSTITEGNGASNGLGSTQGMIMAGVTNPAWAAAFGNANPWIVNPEHFAGAYICFNPNAAGADSLILTFDLKQLFKMANANTNFRITVNGFQVGPTYRPPFATSGAWQSVRVDLSAYMTEPSIEIGFESSVSEEYATGTGPANLVDNISVRLFRPTGTKELLAENAVSVYPNPSNGWFNLKLPKGNNFIMEISDLSGKVIKTQKGNAGDNKLNLEGTAKGIYLLKVSSKEGMAVKKLIVE